MSAERVVLWRHGRTTSNAEGRFQGQLDVPLDDVGQEQARASALVLAALGPDRLVASDLSRAADTAAELGRATGLPVHLDVGLRELHAGTWQGLLHPQIAQRWPDQHAAWRDGQDVAVGGGERRSDVGRRVAAAVLRHVAATPDGGTLVVASHSGALRSGLLELLEMPHTAWPRFSSLGNGRWALLQDREAGWSLRGYDLGPASPSGSLTGTTDGRDSRQGRQTSDVAAITPQQAHADGLVV